jgi:hypothetical protein
MQRVEGVDKRLRIVVPALPGFGWSNQEPRHTANDFEVIARDAAHDLALLRINMQVGVAPGGGRFNGATYSTGVASNLIIDPLPLDGAHVLLSTDDLEMAGYPTAQGTLGHALEWADLVQAGGRVTSARPLDLEGVPLGAAANITVDIAGGYRTDIIMKPGGSGGPVYLENGGSIVGVGIATAEGTLMVPAAHAAELLRANGIAWGSSD